MTYNVFGGTLRWDLFNQPSSQQILETPLMTTTTTAAATTTTTYSNQTRYCRWPCLSGRRQSLMEQSANWRHVRKNSACFLFSFKNILIFRFFSCITCVVLTLTVLNVFAISGTYPEFYIGGHKSRRRRHREGGELEGGIPFSSRLEGLGERRERPQRGPTHFLAYLRSTEHVW